ncbi:hypothetical protein JCM11641_001306 [Rhodosporidiobolus odoratus]
MSTRPLVADSSATDSDDSPDDFPSSRRYPPSRLRRRSNDPIRAQTSRLHRLVRLHPLLSISLVLVVLIVLIRFFPRSTPPSDNPKYDPLRLQEDTSLPVLAFPNGSRYHHPLPPSDSNPWPRKPRIAGLYLSERRAHGTKLEPADLYELPEEYVQATDEVWAHKRQGWEEAGLNSGEGFDARGRPTKVPRSLLYDGKKAGWQPKKVGTPVRLPRIQHASFSRGNRTAEQKKQDGERKEWVRRAFRHLWGNYVEKVWGYDELKPFSGTGTNAFNGWGATIFDSLDTLLIMDLKEEYHLAREHVAKVDFSYNTPRNPQMYPKPSVSALPPLSLFRESSALNMLSEPLTSPAGVPTFETVIRYLGSLLSAYDLSHDPVMLSRARDLGDWLLPSMSTKLGLLVPTYRMGAHSDGGPLGTVCLAEVGSVGLEFLRLSHLTGDRTYFEAVQRSLDTIDEWPAQDRLKGLFPTQINTFDSDALHGTYTFGGQADSYYEYLVKLYQLLGGSPPSSTTDDEDPATQYRRMYSAAIDTAHRHLIRDIDVVPGLEGAVTIGDVQYRRGEKRSQAFFSPRLGEPTDLPNFCHDSIHTTDIGGHLRRFCAPDHLTCFAGGMLGLGSRLLSRERDMETAKKFTKACTWAYDSTTTGLGPEAIELWNEKNPRRWKVVEMEDGTVAKTISGDPPGVYGSSGWHISRPETVESLFYLYRLTGDRAYQDKAWRFFTTWVATTINEGGFSHIDEVNSKTPQQTDAGIESFVYGETLKYYYLIFSAPDVLSLDDYVFSTEAHPFRIPSSSSQTTPPFWTNAPSLEMPDPETIGKGTANQKWARFVQAAAMRGWHWKSQ